MSNFLTLVRGKGQVAGTSLAALLIAFSPLKSRANDSLAQSILAAAKNATVVFYGEPHGIRETFQTILPLVSSPRFDCFAIEAHLPQNKDRQAAFKLIADGASDDATFNVAFPEGSLHRSPEFWAIIRAAQRSGKKILSINRRPVRDQERKAFEALSPEFRTLLTREVPAHVFDDYDKRHDQVRAAMMAEALTQETKACRSTFVLIGFLHAAKSTAEARKFLPTEVRDLFALANPRQIVFTIGDLRVDGRGEGAVIVDQLRGLPFNKLLITAELPDGGQAASLRRWDAVIGGKGTPTYNF